MENLRKRVDVNPVRSKKEDKLRRLIASPAFAWANIFDDDLAAIQIHKSNLVFNRPVYVGMSILYLSKHLMYDFYFNRGWLGGAMVLGKLPVLGRPTILITVGQGPIALAVGAGGGGLDIFTLLYPFSSFSLSLGDGPI